MKSAPTQSGTESDQRTALKSAPTQGGTEPNMERVQSQYIQIHYYTLPDETTCITPRTKLTMKYILDNSICSHSKEWQDPKTTTSK